MKKNLLLLSFLFFVFSNCFSKTDTTQIDQNIKHINELLNTQIDSCKYLIQQNIKESKSIGYQKGTARSYLLLVQFYILKGTPDSATSIIPLLKKDLNAGGDKLLQINILLKIALIYSDLGDFKKAITEAIEAQKLAESINDYRQLAKVNHDLGFIYTNKSLYKNALAYFKKGMSFAMLSKDTFSIANLNARIGGTFNYLKMNDSGLFYNLLSLKYFESIDHQRGVGVAYNNIAGSYEQMKNYSKAIEYFNKAIPIRQALGDDYAITIIKYNLGLCYLHTKNYPLAEEYLNYSLKENETNKDYPQILETLKQLCVLYEEAHKLDKYVVCANRYIYLKDSITSADNIKAIGELQEKYESEKKEKNIALLKKENEKQEEISQSERKNKFVILISSLVVLILMGIFALVLYKRFQVSQKQKNIIERQKNLVDEKNRIVEEQKNILEEKQKEILDSIYYAQKIQQSLLPTDIYIDKNLKRLKKDRK